MRQREKEERYCEIGGGDRVKGCDVDFVVCEWVRRSRVGFEVGRSRDWVRSHQSQGCSQSNSLL